MILLSNGGTNIQRAQSPSDTILVGTVDGVALLAHTERGWSVKDRALQGCFVSAVTALEDGTLFAATRGVGIARSDDGGFRWTWVNEGLSHHEFWSARAGRLMGREAVFVGALPAHLYVSEDKGNSWRELKAFRNAKTVSKWTFPPPPRIGHIKDIVLDGDRLLVGVEIGSLQMSMNFGESFVELPVDPDPQECDIHRMLVHPARPNRIIIANGLVGMMTSDDRGATWRKIRCHPALIILTRSSSIPINPISCSCQLASAGRRIGTSSGERAGKSSVAATPDKPGSGCSAVCPMASERCSAP